MPSSALIPSGEVPLNKLIAQNPLELLGERVAGKFSNTLPYRLKILSVGNAFSIQAHPDKALAKQLHTRSPEHYPDMNHKPEMAIAITAYSLRYGFRDEREILALIERFFSLDNLFRGGERSALAVLSRLDHIAPRIKMSA